VSDSRDVGGAETPPNPPTSSTSSTPRPAPKLVALAEVARPHGLTGELRLKVYNLDSDVLRARPPVVLRMPDGAERPARITAVRHADKALLVKLEGVSDRNAAEALRGAVLLVPRETLPPPAEGEFYICDLEGAEAVLVSGEPVGRVFGLTSYPTCDVLVVERAGGKMLEVPLVEAYVHHIDAARGVVELVTVEGLD
jgi:16S rRNA processing protein RimM